MLAVQGQTLADIYAGLCQQVRTMGNLVSPRGRPTHEILHVGWTVTVPRFCKLQSKDINYRFALAEFMALISGWDDVEWLAHFNKNIAQFSDDGETFYGSYGKRLGRQLWIAAGVLREQPHTRQVVTSIWEPRDLGAESKDIPCNTHMYLKIRDDALHMTVMRRSADLIWGVPYDHYVFANVLMLLARRLRVRVGTLTEFADSLHIYGPSAGYASAGRIERAMSTPTTGLTENLEFDGLLVEETFMSHARDIIEGKDEGSNKYTRLLCD